MKTGRQIAVRAILVLLFAICLPVTLVAVNVSAMTTEFWVDREYGAPDFPASAVFTDAERKDHAAAVISYLRGGSSEEQLRGRRTAANPAAQLLFSDGEADHLADVRGVMSGLNLAGTAAFLVALGILALTLREWGVRAVGVLLLGGPLGAALIGGIAALWAVLDFDGFFRAFHESFFAAGSFSFPSESSIIQLFPERLWIDAASTLAAATIIEGLLVMAAGGLIHRKGRAVSDGHPA